MDIESKLLNCLHLQNKFNCSVNPDWRKAGYAFRRAMWIEAGELIAHYGYKWWKNVDAEPDRNQLLLEAVDIFHFLLSELMIKNETGSDLAKQIIAAFAFSKKHVLAPNRTKNDVTETIEDFVVDCILNNSAILVSYCKFCANLGISLEEIVDGYVVKNVLNFFRLEHGYKEGTYVKMWDGKEDNIILMEVVATTDSKDFRTLYQALTERYQLATMQ